MSRARRYLADFGWVSIGVFFTLTNLARRQWLVTGVWLVITGLHAHLALSIHRDRKEQQAHGHRQPGGSHRDQQPGPGGTVAGGGAVRGPFTHTIGAAGGTGPGIAAPLPSWIFGHGIGQAPTSDWYRSQGAAWRHQRVPSRTSDDTIRAWKRGSIDLMGSAPVLIGAVSRRYLCVDYGIAQCFPVFGADDRSDHSEEAPKIDCTCGFYAVPNADVLDHPLQSGLALLEVELFGKVVRHEKGYRASRQRVLAAHLDPHCHLCHDEHAEIIAVGYRAPVGSMVHQILGTLNHATWASTLCAGCAGRHELVLLSTWTPAALAQTLGTEVRWAAA